MADWVGHCISGRPSTSTHRHTLASLCPTRVRKAACLPMSIHSQRPRVQGVCVCMSECTPAAFTSGCGKRRILRSCTVHAPCHSQFYELWATLPRIVLTIGSRSDCTRAEGDRVLGIAGDTFRQVEKVLNDILRNKQHSGIKGAADKLGVALVEAKTYMELVDISDEIDRCECAIADGSCGFSRHALMHRL